jgi:catechol 2,3-dioxygenase-like lactoylglutathione lyase family enzyme
LRLVKMIVNFDDPNTCHLYYGDEQGTPGSILTFFPGRDRCRPPRLAPGYRDRLLGPGKPFRILQSRFH